MIIFCIVLAATMALSWSYCYFKTDFASDLEEYQEERENLKEQRKQHCKEVPFLKRELTTGSWFVVIVCFKAMLFGLGMYNGVI